MKKLLLSLFAVLSFMAINAATITFKAGTDKSNATTLTKDGVTIKIEVGSSTSGAGSLNLAQYRFYKGNDVTISSATENITKIEFTCTANGTTKYGPGCFTAASGTYAAEGKVGTWTGSSNSVVFTAASAQVRATEIVVTTGAAAAETQVAAPKITPATGTYYNAIEFSATTTTKDATIKYSTDGTNFTDYTAPVSINKDCTVTVYAVKAGLKDSEKVTAEYKFAEATPVANIAAALAKAADKAVIAFANPVTVVYQSGMYTYAKDDSGVLLIYGKVPTYKSGDVIPVGFYGTMMIYNGLYELSTQVGTEYSSDSFKDATENVGAVRPTVSALGEIDATDQNKYVVFNKVKFDKEAKTISDEEDSLPIYYRFTDLSANEAPASGTYNVEGFVSVYNTTVQIFPTAFNDPSGVEAVEAEKAVVVAGEGTINVIGEANDVEVYTIGGALVSKNATSVNAAAGMYIVKVNGKATKVVVK